MQNNKSKALVATPTGNSLTKLEWRQHYLSWQKSMQTKSAYCRAHELKIENFYYWCKQFQTKESEDSSTESEFIAVTLKNDIHKSEAQVPVVLRLPNHAELMLHFLPSQLVPFIKELCHATAIIR